MRIFPYFIAFALFACGGKHTHTPAVSTGTTGKDSLPAVVVTDTLPMMVRMDMKEFNAFSDALFPFDYAVLKSQKVKTFTYTESGKVDGEWSNDRYTKTYELNTDGLPAHYLFTETEGAKKMHEQIFTYRNGLLTESAFINYLWGPDPETTRYTYKNGLLTRLTTTNPRGQVTNEYTYTYAGGVLKTMKDGTNGDEYTYTFTNGLLTGVSMPMRKWEKTYTYNANGMPAELKSHTDYDDHFTFTYNASNQLTQVHWEEKDEPLADIYFEFETNGLIKTIRHVGHAPAMAEERKLMFSYTYYGEEK